MDSGEIPFKGMLEIVFMFLAGWQWVVPDISCTQHWLV